MACGLSHGEIGQCEGLEISAEESAAEKNDEEIGRQKDRRHSNEFLIGGTAER